MTTRRQILAAAVAAPLAASPAFAQQFVCAPSASSSHWDASMARYQAIKTEDRHFHDEIYRPTMDPIHEMAPPYRFEITAKNGRVASYCLNGPDIADLDTGLGGLWSFARDQMAEAKDKYDAYLAAASKVDVAGLNERSDDFGSRIYEAELALLALPAPHLRALEWKVSWLHEHSIDNVVEPDELGLILRDIRRLDGRADH